MSGVEADHQGVDRKGLAAALGCYLAWGSFPLLFDAIAAAGAGPLEIVAWRTVFAAPCAFVLVAVTRRTAALADLLKAPATLVALALSAGLIAVNWSVYIWAVSSGHTLAASLGYYINPLLSLAAGALLFKKTVSRAGWIAVGLASVGVGIQAVALGGVPWIPLVLAGSFAAYGVVRKRVAADAQTGLLVECAILAVPALAFVGWLGARGQGHFGQGLSVTLLLCVAGPVTVGPLAAFAFAARRLPLSTVGFLQFISPTLQFICGLILGERLKPLNLLAFALIWAGVGVFAWSALRASGRRMRLTNS